MSKAVVAVVMVLAGVGFGFAGDSSTGGGRSLKASATTGIEYSDNRDSVASDREDSLDLFLNGRMDFVVNRPQTLLDLAYSPSLRYRTNPSPLQNDTDLYHDLTLAVQHRPVQRLKLAVSDQFNYTDDPAVDVGGNVLRQDASFLLNKVAASAGYECSRLVTCKLDGYQMIKRYDNNAYAMVGDEDAVGGGASASLILDRDLTVAVIGSVGSFGYKSKGEGSRDFTSYEAGIDVSRRYGAKMKGDLAVGWKALNYESSELGTESSPYVSAALMVAQSPRTHFNGSVGYLLRDSDFYPFASQRYLSVDVGASWVALVQRLTLNVGGGYRLGSYDTESLLVADRAGFGRDVDETSWLASLGASWRVRKTYDVSLSQGYERVDYDGVAESFTRNSTRVSVGREF